MGLGRPSGTKGPHSYVRNAQSLNINNIPSGGKIVHILEKNPTKDPNNYDEEDVEHMRRVVAYCKRHLAQEEKAKQDTNSKSYKSVYLQDCVFFEISVGTNVRQELEKLGSRCFEGVRHFYRGTCELVLWVINNKNVL